MTCGHEWAREPQADDDEPAVKDANGNLLRDGESVTVIKDLKVNGSSVTLAAGTGIKGIRGQIASIKPDFLRLFPFDASRGGLLLPVGSIRMALLVHC